jgi:HK97 family phage prohead protease
MNNGILFKQMPGQVNIDEAEGIVECFVAGIGNKDSVGDICAPGSFNASLRRRTPRVVWGHDWNQPIGKVLEIYEVPASDPRLPKKMKQAGIGGLYARVQFNLKSERGREAFASISFFGMDQEWSIGYKTLDAVYDNARQANVLKEVELYEVSPVLHGANQLTGTISIKSDQALLDPETDEEEMTISEKRFVKYLQSISDDEFDDEFPENGEIDSKWVVDVAGAFARRAILNRRRKKMSPNMEKADKRPLKDPKGGLTAAGREYFKRTEGANLKPGVKGPADTPEKMRRKGSFLTRFFTNPSGQLVGDDGKPTRLALSAAAWGEPVPKNAEDAAELAAKGRRLLERYKNQKEKDAKGGDYNDDDMKGKDTNKLLARAVANEMDAPVRLRTSDAKMVIFDIMRDGEKQTFRMAYHYDDGDFMFGRSERVKPETVYLPMGEDGPAHAYMGDEKSLEEELDLWIDDMVEFATSDDEFGSKTDEEAISAIAELVATDIEVKAGRVLSGSNLEKLQQAISILREIAAAGGREDIEMKTPDGFVIPAEKSELFDLRMHLDPVFDHYGAKVLCEEDGIHIKSLTGDVSGFEQAVNTALRGFDSPLANGAGIEEKAIFRRGRRAIGRGGRGGGGGRGRRMVSSADRPSYDGDGDGFITNPMTGRDEIPWDRANETPEQAIQKFFGNRGGAKPQAPKPKPVAKPLSAKKRGLKTELGFDKVKLGDVLPENWDDPSKKLGNARWQITAISRRPDGSYNVRLSDMSSNSRRDMIFPATQKFPNVSRPAQTPAQRGQVPRNETGAPSGILQSQRMTDGNMPPFDPNTRKPAGGDPKKKPQATVQQNLPDPRLNRFGSTGPMERLEEFYDPDADGEDYAEFAERQEREFSKKPTPPKPFTWPKDSSGRVLAIEDLTDQQLADASNYWQGVPFDQRQGQGIQNLREALGDESRKRIRAGRTLPVATEVAELNDAGRAEAARAAERAEAARETNLPDNEIDEYVRGLIDAEGGTDKPAPERRGVVQRLKDWYGEGRRSPSGFISLDSLRTDNGRYYIVDADQFGGTPGKFVIDGSYRYDDLGNPDYFDDGIEFDTVEQAREWIEQFDDAFQDGDFYPADEGFEWPDDPVSNEEIQQASQSGELWKVRVPNKPARDKSGPLGEKERSHNFISSVLDDARALFAQKWIDRRKNQNIQENIEFADDRISELQIMRSKLERSYGLNFPGMEEAYSMSPTDFARYALEQGWVESIAEGLTYHSELNDAWDQYGADQEEIDNMINSINRERQKFIDKYNERWESGNPDFPEQYGS